MFPKYRAPCSEEQSDMRSNVNNWSVLSSEGLGKYPVEWSGSVRPSYLFEKDRIEALAIESPPSICLGIVARGGGDDSVWLISS